MKVFDKVILKVQGKVLGKDLNFKQGGEVSEEPDVTFDGEAVTFNGDSDVTFGVE